MSYQVTKVEILSIDLQIFSKYISCEPAFHLFQKLMRVGQNFPKKHLPHRFITKFQIFRNPPAATAWRQISKHPSVYFFHSCKISWESPIAENEAGLPEVRHKKVHRCDYIWYQWMIYSHAQNILRHSDI